MSERRIVVPEGMLSAVLKAKQMPETEPFQETVRSALEAALRWLSDNPQVPTMEQATEMSDNGHPCVLDGVWYATESFILMFIIFPLLI